MRNSPLAQPAHRVLLTGGQLAIWDITAGTPGPLDYPLPWAGQPELSHLATTGQLRAAIETAGFAVSDWNDLTNQAAALMEAILSLPPSPLGYKPSSRTSPRKPATSPEVTAPAPVPATQRTPQ